MSGNFNNGNNVKLIVIKFLELFTLALNPLILFFSNAPNKIFEKECPTQIYLNYFLRIYIIHLTEITLKPGVVSFFRQL